MSASGNKEEEKKPPVKGAYMNLKVKCQDRDDMYFRMKRGTPLRELMKTYCEIESVDFNSIAFLFNGKRLRAEHTPAELGMEESDEIDAMLHQT